MFYTVRRIYRLTHNEKYLDNAVSRGWITEEEKEIILNEE